MEGDISLKCKDDPRIEQLAEALKVLSEPNRLRIICFLKRGEKCVCEVEEELEISQQLTSFHLRVLRESGFLKTRREGTSFYYSFNPEFMKEINPVLIYIDERLNLGPQLAVSCPVVYRDYKTWCEEGGHRKLSRNRFYAQLMLHLPTVEKKIYGPKRCFHFVGMDLKIDSEV